MTWGRLEDQRGFLSGPGLRNGPTVGRRPHHVGDIYWFLRDAAVEAAQRNNAAIWFIERDRSNVFLNSDGSGGNSVPGGGIGLLLPPSASRGPELFVGGDGNVLGSFFQTSGAVTLENGEFKLTTSGAFGGGSRIITTVVNRWYEVRATYRSGLGNPCTIMARPEGHDNTSNQVQFPNSTSPVPQTHTRYIRATTTQLFIRLTSLFSGSGDVCYFDDLSVREVQGLVLDSATTAQKPTLTQPGGSNPNRIGMRFDGTDDRMINRTSPIGGAAGDSYTLIFSGQLATLTGPRMAVSDGRALGMAGNGTAGSAESLHGGSARYGFTVSWPLNSRRTVSSTFDQVAARLIQRQGGQQVFSGIVTPTSSITPEMWVGSRSSAQEFWQGDIFLACAGPGVMPTQDILTIERFAGFIGDSTVA